MATWINGCFAEKHVLVTGGTSGIGAAIAAAFLAEGAIVTATVVDLLKINAASDARQGAINA